MANQLDSDSFTGTDANPIGGSWATVGTFAAIQRVSNEFKGTAAAAYSIARRTGTTFPIGQYSECKVKTLDSGSVDAGPAVRCDDATGSFFSLQYDGANFVIVHYGNNVYQDTYGSAAGTVAVNDVLRLEAYGGSDTSAQRQIYLRGYKNGSLVVSGVATFPIQNGAGVPGIWAYGTTATADDWTGGDLIPTQFTQLISDDFNRTNETPLGSPWSAAMTTANRRLKVVSNLCEPETDSADNAMHHTGMSAVQDQWARVKHASGTLAEAGPVVRSQGSGNYYAVIYTGACSVVIGKFASDVYSELGDASPGGLSAGDLVTAYAEYSTPTVITALRNGAMVCQVIDNSSPYTTGRPGAFNFLTAAKLDDFTAGDFSTGAPRQFMHLSRLRRI